MKVLPLPSTKPWRYAEASGIPGRFYIYAHGGTQPIFTYHVAGLTAQDKRQLTANLIHIVECVNAFWKGQDKMTRIDVGRLTAEETQSTFIDCGRNLTEEDLFTALEQVLTPEQKADLSERWQFADEG